MEGRKERRKKRYDDSKEGNKVRNRKGRRNREEEERMIIRKGNGREGKKVGESKVREWEREEGKKRIEHYFIRSLQMDLKKLYFNNIFSTRQSAASFTL